jgi:threonylcarbamoyladenosine tRNA methylthiotransferase CDKAL1
LLKRSERLHNIIKQIAKKRNARWLNWEGNILIDEIENGSLKGKNQYYKSVIIKEFKENLLTNIKEDNDSKGSFTKSNKNIYPTSSNNHKNRLTLGNTIKVKITGYSNHMLEGIQII